MPSSADRETYYRIRAVEWRALETVLCAGKVVRLWRRRARGQRPIQYISTLLCGAAAVCVSVCVMCDVDDLEYVGRPYMLSVHTHQIELECFVCACS